MRKRHHRMLPLIGSATALRHQIARKHPDDAELQKAQLTLKKIAKALPKAASKKKSDERLHHLLEKFTPEISQVYRTVQSRGKGKRLQALAQRALEDFVEVGDTDGTVNYRPPWHLILSSLGLADDFRDLGAKGERGRIKGVGSLAKDKLSRKK